MELTQLIKDERNWEWIRNNQQPVESITLWNRSNLNVSFRPDRLRQGVGKLIEITNFVSMTIFKIKTNGILFRWHFSKRKQMAFRFGHPNKLDHSIHEKSYVVYIKRASLMEWWDRNGHFISKNLISNSV